MSLAIKLMKGYFDFVYSPVYDFTTAQFASYRRLQSTCVAKLKFDDGDKVLCVGVGTGNEITHILRRNSNVSIVGVDYSYTALQRAYKKALTWGKKIQVFLMDVRNLQFAAGSFDKIVCLHLMDFVEDHTEVTSEILRVLKDGGQFVVTYPSHKEGPKLGLNLLKDSVRNRPGSAILAFLKSTAQMLVGVVYLPLLFRSNRRSYSRSGLEAMFTQLTACDFEIEEEKVYQAFIVYGRK